MALKGGGHVPRAALVAALLLLASAMLAIPAIPALASDVGVPSVDDGTSPDDGAPVDGGTAVDDGTSIDASATEGGISAPDPSVQPHDPPRTETLPRDKGPSPLRVPGGTWTILVIVTVIGVISTWAPPEVRRMRIESAWRISSGGRLALARGEFALALAAFDEAIEEAHAAYTRRVGPGQPVEWKLLPDAFYIGLWRGRATALRGLGRVRAAEFMETMARELESAVAAIAR